MWGLVGRGCCWDMHGQQRVHVRARVCVCQHMCVCSGACASMEIDIYIHTYVYMCISKPALHACETAASLCCGVSQRVQTNEPAQQS